MSSSKHDLLTQDEFAWHNLYSAIANSIEQYCLAHALKPKQMNVLDWGCGRGRDALWLLERGYNAYGVDVDPEPIQNGLSLYQQRGFGKDRLQLIDLSAKTGFTDGFFHFTFSNQSFEHAANLKETAVELWRITTKGGVGYHVFPPKWGIREGHLYMPFVHWLSKNRLRWWWIRMFVAIGVEPKWQELEGKTGRQKTERYFEYINANTFYRRPSEIRRIFEVQGFKVDFVTTQDPRVQRHPLLGQMARFKLTWGLINWLLVNFVRVELKIEKHTGNSKQ